MTQILKTKQQLIEEAWKDLWPKVKDRVDKDGYCNNSDGKFRFGDCWTIDPVEYKHNNHFRPKALGEILHNNGWINVEDELPTETAEYWIEKANGRVIACWWNSINQKWMYRWNVDQTKQVVAWQPLNKPKTRLHK